MKLKPTTWRHLAALTQPPGGSRLEGNRIDLLQCGVISNGPVEGAALLKELWAIAGIPVTASDDALSGFLLATFLEQAKTQSLSIIRSTIPGVDYYWRRADLLGSASPSQQYGGGGVPGGGIMAAYPGAPLPREKRDVLERFSHQAALQGTTPPALFRKADTAGAGKLSAAQVSGMCREVLPDVSVGDAQHFQAILGAEGEATITEPEFSQRLKEGAAMHAKLRAGQDESGLLRNLSKYMTDNEPIIRQFFEASDINGSGKLEHSELADFARCIPDLLPAEQKFIITFMNQVPAAP
ncbi:hypothetical protein FOA52_000105 [Chlamydomonas sp. UWO 241]|nr:hypothetical protein FOA52_000105 [Chlamydomonas sp. UWO 241]